MTYPVPSNEAERLRTLRSYKILDTKPEERFDELTQLAALICDAPISLIRLIDTDRQWFKSRFGLDMQETPGPRHFAPTPSCNRKCSWFRMRPRTNVSHKTRS
jgi:hypothetical protein